MGVLKPEQKDHSPMIKIYWVKKRNYRMILFHPFEWQLHWYHGYESIKFPVPHSNNYTNYMIKFLCFSYCYDK